MWIYYGPWLHFKMVSHFKKLTTHLIQHSPIDLNPKMRLRLKIVQTLCPII